MIFGRISAWLVSIINRLFRTNIGLLPSSNQNAEQPMWERTIPTTKQVYLSRVTMTEVVLPSHADTRGFIYGGVVLGWIDLAAGISAKKHAIHPCVIGDFVIIRANVNKAWNTSMEVGVRVETENPLTGKRKYCCHAYLTFVALTPKDNIQIPGSSSKIPSRYQNVKVKVPQIVSSTSIEKQRYELAEERRQTRLAHFLHEDERGDREQNKLAHVRELMKTWSEYSNTETKRIFPNQPEQKFISESFAEVVETVLPQHANTLQMDGTNIDSLQFIKPTYVGDCVTVRSVVSCTFHSSLEVYCSVEAENLMTGERFFANDGFFTMVAVDFENSPTPVPRAIPDDEQEKELFAGAELRRKRRLGQRRELIQKELSAHPEEFEQVNNY
ncbi:11408_t:CDS:10 [Diversispora eburnea]|uniref:11408_t:CDS:1 n=2 Tax=Diversisporales TaxID=214509 RepID=A0A9N8VLR3_9GLOM|nr:11408_t:CDS:10 [Diversispora eburnea]